MEQQLVKPLDENLKQILPKIANTIRHLSIDAVQKANSGHPGLPLGCAEIGAYLWGHALQHNPKDPHWINRDRFILSAGHGSAFLYSCLHLAGYDLSLDELKRFRKLHSQTPGHPESFETDGVETTTGPLGQGVSNAVGTALGMKILEQKFSEPDFSLFDAKVFCLAGDGCMMEGVCSEASSLAGHLQLDNLILIYDSNRISLDGPLEDSCSEDTKMRYMAYHWDVYEVDGHDLTAIHEVVTKARTKQKRPVLIIAKTIIGKGSPHKQGSSKAHGAPLGEEEVRLTKEALGLPPEEFYIPHPVSTFFEKKIHQDKIRQEKWQRVFESWSRKYPERRKEFDAMHGNIIPENIEELLSSLKIQGPLAGRMASHAVINFLADTLPQLYGGSADLSCSDATMMEKYPIIQPKKFTGRNIKFGVREFAMASMATGLRQTRCILPFVGTFLTFSDYMRNAIRLASLMKEQVVYQFTHDSIFLGEDGPTHQPVEHISSLRLIPNLQVIRPSGVHEVKMAWLAALKYQGPTALILSRQTVQEVPGTEVPFSEGLGRGAYIVKKESSEAMYTLIATGSELPLAVNVAHELEKLGKAVRVVSMPCCELFEKQSDEYKQKVLGDTTAKRISIEAGQDLCWYKYIGLNGYAVGVETFGLSAPQRDLESEFGFTVEAILERILQYV